MHRNERYNKMLPKLLQNDWRCLPLWMRSLEPLDLFFGKLKCCYGAQTTKSKQVEIPTVTVSDKPSEESSVEIPMVTVSDKPSEAV